MATQTKNNQPGLVRYICKIRDQISIEIKDMIFEQERAYLDNLLTGKRNHAPHLAIAGHDIEQGAMNGHGHLFRGVVISLAFSTYFECYNFNQQGFPAALRLLPCHPLLQH